MSINKLTPPATANDAVTHRLAALERANGRSADREAGGGFVADPDNCLPVYHLDSNVLKNNSMSLLAAKPVGWRYLVGHGENARSVEVVNDKAVAVDRSQVTRQIANALKLAEGRAFDQAYEARMLTFGRVSNPVLWLHSEEGGVERFFSLGDEPSELAPDRFLAKASKAARVRQATQAAFFDDTDDESGG